MREDNVRSGSLRAWMLAARPKTLTGAAVPVLIGVAMALVDGRGSILLIPALLCFAFAMVMQIDANFVNDYFDYVRGNDDETRLGPLRACAQGWVTVKSMRIAIVITTVAACLIGLPLVMFGGWEMVVVGAICVLFCFLYTTCLSYLGLGDILVLVFFGVVPVCLTYYLCVPLVVYLRIVEPQNIPWEVFLTSLSCGIVVDNLLIVNNYRDIDNDRRAGKKTLAVRMGAKASRWLYLSLGFVACLIGVVHLFENRPLVFLTPLIYLFFHVKTWKKMCTIGKGRELNAVLGLTARNIFIYGVLVVIGCMASLC